MKVKLNVTLECGSCETKSTVLLEDPVLLCPKCGKKTAYSEIVNVRGVDRDA